MRHLFITPLLVIATLSWAQDAPYSPNTGNSSYSSPFSKDDESAKYEIRRDNWRYNSDIRGGSWGGGGNLRTPDAPPDVTKWNDYGKADAWKKSNKVDDELVCREKHKEVQKMQADITGMAFKKLDARRVDYHTYLSIANEGTQRMKGHVWRIHRLAVTGTAVECMEERDNAAKVFTEVWRKLKIHEREFTNLRGIE